MAARVSCRSKVPATLANGYVTRGANDRLDVGANDIVGGVVGVGCASSSATREAVWRGIRCTLTGLGLLLGDEPIRSRPYALRHCDERCMGRRATVLGRR